MTIIIPTLAEYRAILRRDPMTFTERVFRELNPATPFMPAPYIELIVAKLDACRRGEIKRLMILAPPRGMKSICASIAFPAWLLAHQPTAEIICASYGQELAEKLARDCRTVMESSWYKEAFPTRLDRRAAHDFVTTVGGRRMATSVTGPVTGRGANFIILDDVLKPDEAVSDSQRSKANDWFGSTLSSRLNNQTDGCIIAVMQRLHMDDLPGYLMEKQKWDVLALPAIAEEDEHYVYDTPFGQRSFQRRAGQVLHPGRDSLEKLKEIESTIGTYNFSGQYQQRPIPLGGAMIKSDWLMRHDLGPLDRSGFSIVLQSWDTANKTGELNDYSVCTTWGLKKGQHYLLDVFRKKLNYPDLKRAVMDLWQRYRPIYLLIEDKASGTQLIDDLKADGVYPVTSYKPAAGVEKGMRLNAVSALFENGLVFLPRQAPWLAAYETELISFPGAAHDDQVDSTSQALDFLKGKCSLAVWEKLGRG